MSYESINPRIIASIRRYADEHCPTDSFLQAVLSNDLTTACVLADDDNLRVLLEIVKYCYNQIPSKCWGTPGKVEAWLGVRPANNEDAHRDNLRVGREIIQDYREQKGRI